MKIIQHKFVEFIPPILDEGFLYISIDYKTALHLCICGCGNKVVTPISPSGWKLTFNGKSVSLYPSIGNWNFPCKSHYFITENVIQHAYKWEDKEKQTKNKPDKKSKVGFWKRKRKQ